MRNGPSKKLSRFGLFVYIAFLNANVSFLKLLPPLKGPLPSLIKVQEPPTEPELLLLRSIEWTTFSEETYEVALEQACVILRYFLGKHPPLFLIKI